MDYSSEIEKKLTSRLKNVTILVEPVYGNIYAIFVESDIIDGVYYKDTIPYTDIDYDKIEHDIIKLLGGYTYAK